jgi:hypothetical protein
VLGWICPAAGPRWPAYSLPFIDAMSVPLVVAIVVVIGI